MATRANNGFFWFEFKKSSSLKQHGRIICYMEGMFVRLFCQFWCGSEILDGCHHRALKFNIDCNMEYYIYNKRRLSWYQIMEIHVWMAWIIILKHKWQLQDPWGPNLGSKDYVDCKEFKKCNIKIIQWKCNWIWPEVSFRNVFSSFYKLHEGSKFDRL
jgi:hypothetical protein